MKLLVIEDEIVLANNIRDFLIGEGYLCQLVDNFEAGIEKVSLYQYDCVLIDITLPGGSGLQIVERLKQISSSTGIIIISAKNSLNDKMTGLDLGADDYLTKPFHIAELNSRIKSVIRRRNFEGQIDIVFEEIKIILEQKAVYIGEMEIRLTRKEYDLLLFFIMNKMRVLTRESIAEHLYGDDADTADSFDFLYSQVKNLRKKIEDAGGIDYIHTVYGIGYKFGSL